MKKFGIGIGIRVAVLLLLSMAFAFLILQKYYVFAFFLLAIISQVVYNIYTYVTSLNRKMKRLFEAIQYQDFAITFKADNALGQSFKDLNADLNAVISSFNQVRAEREASLHFINAIVQQISVGIFSYDTDGKIELHNQAASKLLKVYRLKHLNDIEQQNPLAFGCISSLKTAESKLLTFADNDLSFSATDIQMRGRKIRLVAIHNIRSELQIRELEAWQNLTKVLRHEIMNSVTPIVSLAETMNDIVANEISAVNPKEEESLSDLKEALRTIQRRGSGIMRFVNAYREFTSIPLPNKTLVSTSVLFKNLDNFFFQKAHEKAISLTFDIQHDFEILIDADQIEQLLINLIKNALEANFETPQPHVHVQALLRTGSKIIEISDNGTGIEKEAQDKIFIPFFTTKKEGSGIGLSLSRQMMALNGGSINFSENTPSGAIFTLQFA